jgi:hypothetical protein
MEEIKKAIDKKGENEGKRNKPLYPNTGDIASSVGVTANDEERRMWKKAVVTTV